MSRLIALAPLFLFACSSPATVPRLELTPGDWTSFDFTDGQHILMQGTINGHQADIVLDTGAEISMIDQSFAESIGARKEGGVRVIGAGGTVEASLARGLEISSGNLSIYGVTAAIVDFSAFAPVSGHPTTAILGTEAFMQAVVDIDYPNRRIAFRPAQEFNYDGPGSTVEVKHLGGGRHAIEASIEGRQPGWFLIDTGGDLTASVYPSFAKRQRLLDDRAPTSEWISLGIGGLISETTASIEGFSIGGFELKDMPIVVPGDHDGRLADEDVDGILGGGVLSRFRIIFDYGRGHIHMEPGPGWQARRFSRNLVGLAVLPEGDRLQVVFVAPGSPAEHAGWQQGMFVTAIEGRSGTGMELRAKLRERSGATPGTRIVLLDENGTERSVVLTRFY